ncbi:MAG: hypothetical protein R3251_03360 [Candidatus Spechtbacterales bacterium]|nr:hypothetical protein [Candidatus Spechtbacterales bacterium]
MIATPLEERTAEEKIDELRDKAIGYRDSARASGKRELAHIGAHFIRVVKGAEEALQAFNGGGMRHVELVIRRLEGQYSALLRLAAYYRQFDEARARDYERRSIRLADRLDGALFLRSVIT